LSPEEQARKRRQKWLIAGTAAALVLVAAGVATFNYIESAPQRSDKEFQEGMKNMRPGKYREAVVHLTKALEISPGRADAYLERADAHRTLQEQDLALADFESAALLNPNLAAAHNGIAVIYIDRHDFPRALEELNKSLALQPNLEAYYHRAEILEAQGEHQKAVADYDLAIAQERDAPYMYRARAKAKENLGDLEGAHADRELASGIERRP
jgi:tetratricopeptide (TPR) repeat protein